VLRQLEIFLERGEKRGTQKARNSPGTSKENERSGSPKFAMEEKRRSKLGRDEFDIRVHNYGGKI
jgi:hypothetical protein